MILLFYFLSLLISSSAQSATATIDITVTSGGSDEEFVGPFVNWVNAKTGMRSDGTGSSLCTGATGDGVTDDTAAIQTCLNILDPSVRPVLYFPAGTYNVVDVATTATASSGASSLTVASATGIKAGMLINGTNIQPGTVVTTSYTPGSTTVPLNLKTLGALSTTAVKFSPGIWSNGSISLIGHDPSDTIIKWAGSSGGVMFGIVGVNYSRFNRLTFDGNNTAGVIIQQTFDGNRPETGLDIVNGNFDTGNEYADDVFKNAGIGLHCGIYAGCAETSILRSRFSNLTTIGLLVRNFNALDQWVWYSTFTDNNVAVGNIVPDPTWGNPAVSNGAGAFQISNSIFQNSTTVDIAIGNTGAFNVLNNYSSGSKAFVGYGGTGGANAVLIQGNTVLDTTDVQAIAQDNRGPLILLDNVIRSANGATFTPSPCTEIGRRARTCPVVMVGNYNASLDYDLFSMGNTFTLGTGDCTSSTSGTTAPVAVNGRCHSINDQIVSRASVNPTSPPLPGTPPNLGRTVYEASPSGSGTTCNAASPCQPQAAIDKAVVGCSNNVAHLQPGNYTVTTTVVVPANCAVQIIGDNYGSKMISAGADPVLRVLGPSLATLREFAINGITQGQDGIEITSVDTGGTYARVFAQGAFLGGNNINVFVDGIDYAQVELHDAQNLYNNSSSTGGITVTGGAHGGKLNQYFGLVASFQGYGYSVSGGGSANIVGVWNETASSLTNLLKVSGTGSVSYSSSMFEMSSAQATSAAISNFTGTMALVGLYQQRGCPDGGHACGTYGNYEITGTGIGGNVLALGLVCPYTTCWNDSSGDTNKLLNSQRLDVAQITEVGSADATFLGTTLAQLRSNRPSLRGNLFSGITNVGMYRVNVNNARYGLHLKN